MVGAIVGEAAILHKEVRPNSNERTYQHIFFTPVGRAVGLGVGVVGAIVGLTVGFAVGFSVGALDGAAVDAFRPIAFLDGKLDNVKASYILVVYGSMQV